MTHGAGAGALQVPTKRRPLPPSFIPFAGLQLSRLRGGDNAPMNS